MIERVVHIETAGGSFEAEYREPQAQGPMPLIVVVPSIMGVTDGLKQTITGYAERGYLVVAPDPFWRTHPGPLTMERYADALVRLEASNIDDVMLDITAVTAHVASMHAPWNQRFAILGFCFGGPPALLGLTRLAADAAVAFHGTGMQKHLQDAQRVERPFSFHFGEADPLVPPQHVAEIRAALAGKGGEIHVYPGVGHAFAQVESRNYRPEIARASEERAFAMLESLKRD